jgi:hypothetical protein
LMLGDGPRRRDRSDASARAFREPDITGGAASDKGGIGKAVGDKITDATLRRDLRDFVAIGERKPIANPNSNTVTKISR